jgi:oligosaccharyltransferase complex subunit alpha (ribophorin I)
MPPYIATVSTSVLLLLLLSAVSSSPLPLEDGIRVVSAEKRVLLVCEFLLLLLPFLESGFLPREGD